MWNLSSRSLRVGEWDARARLYIREGGPRISIERRMVFCIPVKIESFSAYVMFMYEPVPCLMTVEKESQNSCVYFIFLFLDRSLAATSIRDTDAAAAATIKHF